VLIMDEPTGNLDATSEALVLAATSRLSEGRTTFIIAHRLSVAREADLIIAMREGRIMETGTHRELLDTRGVYHHLWRRQVGESLEELGGVD
jgi:ATP-binding cassette subfamily B protein